MPTLTVTLPHHQYDILIEPGLLDQLGHVTRTHAPHSRCALVSDQNVFHIYGQTALNALADAGYGAAPTILAPGEKYKNLQTVEQLYDAALQHKLERRSPFIALGGGVIGDTTGFAAATYLRGVPFVQCPTTLLAMVDSSVGGKVGVNVTQGKNLIGSFYHPVCVVIDPFVLQTLPPRELRCGLAECVKHGVIRDASLFDFIRQNLAHIQSLRPRTLTELIHRNVAIKAGVVIEDEKETSVRAHLNFGHTFAHAIEATAGYGVIEHGEAVSLGMIAATQLAVSLKLCPADLMSRIKELLQAIGLPVTARLPEDSILTDAMKMDKKMKDDALQFILPTAMGHVTIHKGVREEQVIEAWQAIRQ